jgi:hypothetical protein
MSLNCQKDICLHVCAEVHSFDGPVVGMHLSSHVNDAVSLGTASQDVSLWRRLAKMSSDQGFMRQAIYCYNKVVAANKADLDALWDRAVLYSNVDEPRKVRYRFTIEQQIMW